MRPAVLCRQLLDALQASEGRRRKRKRNTTPDSIGMDIRRGLLEAAVRDDPAPEQFEAWLMEYCITGDASGPVRSMAASLLSEWRLALESDAFRNWLAAGAPSDDRA
jgi:hypothetical protein